MSITNALTPLKKTRKPRTPKLANYDQILQAALTLNLEDEVNLCKELRSDISKKNNAIQDKAKQAAEIANGI